MRSALIFGIGSCDCITRRIFAASQSGQISGDLEERHAAYGPTRVKPMGQVLSRHVVVIADVGVEYT